MGSLSFWVQFRRKTRITRASAAEQRHKIGNWWNERYRPPIVHMYKFILSKTCVIQPTTQFISSKSWAIVTIQREVGYNKTSWNPCMRLFVIATRRQKVELSRFLSTINGNCNLNFQNRTTNKFVMKIWNLYLFVECIKRPPGDFLRADKKNLRHQKLFTGVFRHPPTSLKVKLMAFTVTLCLKSGYKL